MKNAKGISQGYTPYYAILDRDVPTIIEHSRSYAREGVCAPIVIYYRHEAIAGQSTASNHPIEDYGWKPTGIEIPCNIPYTSYYNFLAQRLTRVPLYA